MPDSELVDPVKELAAQAARHILSVYDSDFDVEHKEDASPVTRADLASHSTIVDGLSRLTPELPILSEESADVPFEIRRTWNRYWLVDPLDGTKEFIKRNGEFTVNIALIDRGRAVVGVVWVPVTARCYTGVLGEGAYVQEPGGTPRRIRVRELDARYVRVAGSRSHRDPTTAAFITTLERSFGAVEMQAIGSSLKLCLVAEGRVDIYPRFGPTCEWDTAAAQAVVEAAGGFVVDTRMQPLRYNAKDALLNPHFLVFGDDTANWGQYIDTPIDPG